MCDNNSRMSPRGRQFQGIPPYGQEQYGQQRPAPNLGPQQPRSHVNQLAAEPYGSYYVEDTPSQTLSPPRSNYARGPPPSRPQRPDHSPVTDYVPSPQQRRHQMYQQFFEESNTHHGTGQWTEDGYASPSVSRQSPLEALIKQRAPLGPPPSARRGPSSYYHQDTQHVDPIVEETDSKRGSMQAGSHNSVSSNNNTSLGVPSYYRDDASSIYSGVPSMPPSLRPATTSPVEPPRPVSTISGLNALVRNASIGLKTTPKVTTVRSPDKATQSAGTPKRQEFPVTSPVKSAKSPISRDALPKLYPRSHGGSSDALGSASLDASASESDEPDTLRPLAPVRTKSSSPLVPAELRKEGVEATPSAFRSGKKRPPRLDMSAVTEAEQRGSLTSLPDLIKRATRLASNLDRGKTASRLGMGAWLNDSANQSEKGKSGPPTARRSANSLTDMLASFPPPAVGTPTESPRGKDRKRALSTWSSNLRFSPQLQSHPDLTKEKLEPRSERSHDKRRYCGLPLWLLILLIVVTICLIAVAIVLPVVLVVIPQQRNAQTSANTTSICEQKYSCQNGGASIVTSDGSCQCVCINGYTGATCTQQDRTGCYTVSIGGTNNVTLGSAIPRIIDSAYKNFSIPLQSSTLLGLFSSSALSCTVENALVTFNDLAQRDVNERRQAAATSEGIVYQNGGPTSSTTLVTKTSTTAATASATASFTASATALDFARTAVLFIFQQTESFNSSYAAQRNFQRFFSSPSGSLASANSLGLGSGYSADLTSHHVILPNGTMVGGGSGHA